MAEIGTIIAIVQLADRVIELSKYWIEGVRDAESDLRSILIETSMLKAILENIRFLSDCSDGLSTTLVGLSTSGGPLSHCQRILDEIINNIIPFEILGNGQQPASEKDKFKFMIAKLGWANKRARAQKLLDELQRYNAAINLALITESLHDIREIKTKTDLVLAALSDAEKREFCQWYQQTNPSSLHNRAWGLFEQGTCEWIHRVPEWEDWLQKKHRCLWVHGIPGAGKTILASYMVHQLESYCESQANSVALYSYCYFANIQNEAAPLLRWIITKLCRHTNSVPASAYQTFKKGRDPNLSELLTALAEILEPMQTVYIVVDALDESKPRDELLKVIRDLVTDARFDKAQVVATSREYIDIERVLEDISAGVSMSNPWVNHDIALCVRSVLQNGPSFKRWPTQLLDEVENTLAARAKGMFRWAICQLDRLRRLKGNACAVRKAVSTLPKTLDETYQRIFAEIPEEDRDIVRLCLGWIDFHNRLFLDSIPFLSLSQALNSAQQEQRDWSIVDEEDLKEICGCLIRTFPGYGFGYPIPARDGISPDLTVVAFAHYTVREFLVDSKVSTSPAGYFVLDKQLSVEVAEAVLLTAPRCDTGLIRDYMQASERIWNLHLLKTFSELVSRSLESYCALAALEMISDRQVSKPLSYLLSEPGLLSLILDFLEPSNDRVDDIEYLLFCWRWIYPDYGHALTWHPVPGPACQLKFCEQNWATNHTSAIKDAMHLFMALEFARWSLFPALARELFNRDGKNAVEILEAPVMLVDTGLQEGSLSPASLLSCSVIEYTASKAISDIYDPHELGQSKGDDGTFGFMMDLPGVPSSKDQATAVLQAHSIAHGKYCEQAPTCFFKALLDSGANPHGMISHATRPIQRTAGTADWHGVEMLLCAGADVNDLGDPSGTRTGYDFGPLLFQDRPYRDMITDWTGKSPLWILYHIRKYPQDETVDCSGSRKNMERTAEILIRHGAKALRLEDGDIVEYPEIRDMLMRPFEEWNLPEEPKNGPGR
ncbi:hypothetical protein V8F20_001473 [Naviculisporaceae sp. PSN 640]